MLADNFVLLDRLNQLPSLPPVMGTGLFDVDIFAGLRRPDPHKRMPVIRRGNGDRVHVLVFQQFPNIGIGLRLTQAHCFGVAEALG